MNPEIKTQWVAALRSGEFRQGTGCLHRVQQNEPDSVDQSNRPDTYCCLGVLCVLAQRAGVVTAERHPSRVAYAGTTATLPTDVLMWAGLPIFSEFGGPSGLVLIAPDKSLASLNDGGTGFAEIADIIEEYL